MTAGRMRSEPKINFKATELVNKLSLVRRINDDLKILLQSGYCNAHSVCFLGGRNRMSKCHM
jgi:hypothetical protein